MWLWHLAIEAGLVLVWLVTFVLLEAACRKRERLLEALASTSVEREHRCGCMTVQFVDERWFDDLEQHLAVPLTDVTGTDLMVVLN